MTKNFICDFKITGKGNPLFLIHGIGASKNSWQPMIEELSKSFTVITYDLRGHGKSLVNKKNFTFNHLINDLENLRGHLDIQQGYFAGHSLGGMIAPMYAIKYPSRVLKIGMFSTIAGRSDEDKKKILDVIKEMQKKGIEKTLSTLINRWFTDNFIKNNADLVNLRLNQVLKTNPQVFLNVFNIYANTEIFLSLKHIIQPTLLLTGEYDLGCSPKHNKLMAKEIKKSKLVILPKLKHSILIESPEKISKNIIDFFYK